MQTLRFIDATTQEHYAAMSLLHALGWRTTYADSVPPEFMAREITDHRWVDYFRENFTTKGHRGLLLYRGETPVACISYGPVRMDSGKQGGEVCPLDCTGLDGWGEIVSFYNHPEETGKGYGSLLLTEVLDRMRAEGRPGVVLYVLRENLDARRFYERHGFAPDGTEIALPFPPDRICVDLRYLKKF